MKKATAAILALVLGIAYSAQAVTLAVVLQLAGVPSPDPAYKAVNAFYTISDSVALTEIPETSADNIMLPLATPGTWKSLIVAAIVSDASNRGFTLTAANVRFLTYEPGDYKDTRPAVSWTKDKTFVNLPAALTNVYAALGGEQQLVDFSGFTQYRFGYAANKIGNTGTHYAALVDAANAANIIELADATAATGEHAMDSGWVNLPAWAVGEKLLKPMARDPLATGDDVYHGFQLYLR
jgi:hypothetical protein